MFTIGLGLGNHILLELAQNLDVARVGHAGTDAAETSVCASAALHGALDGDVGDDEVLDVEVLGNGVGLNVLQQTEEGLNRLDGPATGGDLELLGLGRAAAVVAVPEEGHAALAVHHILEVLAGL